ncbi:MAG: TonB-dependent receptor [Agriterribacter sp.]
MIKSVEIITTPSAKYDAEGAAGVINIITKKGKSDFSGTLEASVSNMAQMLNPRISFAKEKWNINLAGHLHRLRNKSTDIVNRTSFSGASPVNSLQQVIESDNAAPHGSADLTIDYAIDETSELSLGANMWAGNWPENNRISSIVRTPDESIAEQYVQNTSSRHNYLGVDVNLGYNKRLKKPGQQFTLLVQNAPSRDLSNYALAQRSNSDVLLYRELNNSKTKNREWTVQADYIHPLNTKGTLHLEAGTKFIFRNVGNRYNVSASDPQDADNIVPLPERSDDFRYSQDVYAGYSMLKMNLKNNWYVEAGARLEATYIKGNFVYSETAFDNHFLNFIPTATISKKIDERNTLNISYTRRLTRPYIWDLNPNADASDPKNIVSGNPHLQPETAHQAEIAYNLNTGQAFFLNTALFWKQTNNAIVEFMQTNAQGISFTSKQNLAANKQFGINFSATANLSERWTLNGNVNTSYYDYSSIALTIFRSGWGADMNLNSTFRLPNNFSVQIFGEYETKAIRLLGTEGSVYQYSFAGKKDIKKARMSVTLAAVNLFSTYIAQTDYKQRPDFISNISNRFYNRAVKLTVNWEFGGTTKQRERKKIENTDVNVQGKG